MTHTVTWTLSPDYIEATFACDRPDGSRCRQVCQGGCEWWSTDDDVTCAKCGTALVSSECQTVLFLNEGGTAGEQYEGPETSIMDGPIEVEWNGDGYTWRYGDKYAGPHGVCYMSLESKAKQFRAALSDLRHTISANAEVGHEIRLLLLPGIKRKTYRREELQSIVDAADGSRA